MNKHFFRPIIGEYLQLDETLFPNMVLINHYGERLKVRSGMRFCVGTHLISNRFMRSDHLLYPGHPVNVIGRSCVPVMLALPASINKTLALHQATHIVLAASGTFVVPVPEAGE
jgi:hypothetical protein